VLVGDGPLRDRVPDSIGFVPPAQIGAYLQRAAVVACPSHREGYGVLARQAMAYGRPVVATAVGGLAEAVVEEETGLLVPVGDARALRRAIQRLLDDRPLRERLGEAGRRRAIDLYGLDAAAERLIGVYRGVLGLG
jgi:glycosyltransferase involved in cell wall biosynthesis